MGEERIKIDSYDMNEGTLTINNSNLDMKMRAIDFILNN